MPFRLSYQKPQPGKVSLPTEGYAIVIAELFDRESANHFGSGWPLSKLKTGSAC